MRAWGRFSAFLSLSIVCICACKAGTQAPTPQTTINAPQGGKIVYGAVNGATTQAAAMTKLLSTVHAKCGEKPQIGKVFQFRGTNSVGVFFTVTDHPEGNIPLAGMVIAAATGPN
jgi:ABC-type phosphate transport system substrate-binding protein